MSTYLLILINERSQTDFIDELHRLIQPFSNYSILLYFTPSIPEIEAGIPFQFRLFQGNYSGKFKTINHESSLDEFQIDLLINLSGLDILDEKLQKIPELKSDFFSQLYMQYCPAIINGIINHQNTCKFLVTLRREAGVTTQLIEGNFKLLNYDYKKALELLYIGNVQLLADGIKRFVVKQFGPVIQKEKHIQPFNPANLQVLKRRLNQNKFKHRIRQLFYYDKWNVGIIDASIEEVALNKGKTWEVNWMQEAVGDGFIADPFELEINGSSVIYVEHYINNKGNISTADDSGLEIKLELPVHLSYPYTFSHEGRWYCIPEQSASNKIELFQINPTTFLLEKPIELISNFQAVDPSLILKDGQWFLFCTDASSKGADVRLYIFISDSLEGPYRAHQQNPVKVDVQSARCAGKIFSKNGNFYRPSQNSSASYGGEIIIHCIEVLSEKEYSETEINRISPTFLKGNYHRGCHTISSLGNRTLIDGKRNVFSLRNFFQKLRKKQNA